MFKRYWTTTKKGKLMTPNELTKAICEYGLKPYITFEIVRNHYECHLKP